MAPEYDESVVRKLVEDAVEEVEIETDGEYVTLSQKNWERIVATNNRMYDESVAYRAAAEKWRLEARRNERALHATLWTGAGLVLAIGLMHIVIHWTVCR